MEEATFLFANKRFGVTHQLLDSLHSVYPYVYKNGDYQAFFSRYPAEPIHLDVNYKELEGYISAYRVTVDDRLLTVSAYIFVLLPLISLIRMLIAILPNCSPTVSVRP